MIFKPRPSPFMCVQHALTNCAYANERGRGRPGNRGYSFYTAHSRIARVAFCVKRSEKWGGGGLTYKYNVSIMHICNNIKVFVI